MGRGDPKGILEFKGENDGKAQHKISFAAVPACWIPQGFNRGRRQMKAYDALCDF
jgi:hypothetical protein